MIGTRAVRAFLEQSRNDFRVAKGWTDKDLQAQVQLLPTKPPIWDQLHQHQKICFLLGAQNKHFAFFNDTGTGKTLLAIALAKYFKAAGAGDRYLVLVQRRINKWEWAREIRKHAPNTEYLVLKGGSKNKWQQLDNSNALLTIETYAGFARMLCAMVPHNHGKRKNKLVPSPELVKALSEHFHGMILDESYMVKNHQSLPFRICRQLRKVMNVAFCLTGTPFGRDPMDLWSQMFLVDQGKTLGPTLTLYRSAFFHMNQNYWGGLEYTFDKKKQDLLHQVLANGSIRYEANAADLPEIVEIKKYATLPEDAEVYYKKAREQILEAKGNKLIIRNAFLRMRQLSSGFLGYEDQDTGEKAKFVFPYNPKLELLTSIIESIRPELKIIIFHDFIFSGDRICDMLKELKIGYLRIDGRTKDAAGTLERFDKDTNKQVMVLNNAMGVGLNLQIAVYGVYYEAPVPVIMRTQTRRRFERQGSSVTRKFLYDLITRGTVDEQILAFHKQGADLFKAICDGQVRL